MQIAQFCRVSKKDCCSESAATHNEESDSEIGSLANETFREGV